MAVQLSVTCISIFDLTRLNSDENSKTRDKSVILSKWCNTDLYCQIEIFRTAHFFHGINAAYVCRFKLIFESNLRSIDLSTS